MVSCCINGYLARDTSLEAANFSGRSASFVSSKEKPSIDPVLSALINEDVKKNIESRKLVEETENRLHPREARAETATESSGYVLTTEKHSGLVDSGLKLDGQGSDKQTSRIQVKTGPNGVDYEYEYVYYYYDDEDSDKTKAKASGQESDTKSGDTRGKNRYMTADRSAQEDSARSPSRKPMSRSDDETSAAAAGSEERLPQNTRFPPRATVTATPVTEEVKQQQQKIRRPSLVSCNWRSYEREGAVLIDFFR